MDSTETTDRKTVSTQEELVRSLIDGFSTQGTANAKPDQLKISVTDLIRLLQFQREMESERPADIVEVRWIEPKQEI